MFSNQVLLAKKMIALISLLCVIALLCTGLNGTATQSLDSYSLNQAKRSWNQVPVAKPLWTANLGESDTFDPQEQRSAAVGERVYYFQRSGNNKGQLVAADLRTGKVVWRRGQVLGAPMIATKDYILATTPQTGMVYRFEPTRGNLVWSYNTGKAVIAGERVVQTMKVDGNRLLLIASGALTMSSLTSLDLRTGKVIWEKKAPSFNSTFEIVGSLLVVRKRGGMPNSPDTFQVYNKMTGSLQAQITGQFGQFLAIRGELMYLEELTSGDANALYAVSVAVYNLRTGALVSVRKFLGKRGGEPVSPIKRLLMDGDYLYYYSPNWQLYRFDLLDTKSTDGVMLLDGSSYRYKWLTGPAAGKIFFWNEQMNIPTTLKLSDLSLKTYDGLFAPLSQLQVIRSAAYVGQTDGHLYAINLNTGKTVFRFLTSGRTFAPFQVSGNTLLAESDDQLLVFRVPGDLLTQSEQAITLSMMARPTAKLEVNGRPVTLKSPMLSYQSRFFLPMREIVSQIGFTLSFDSKNTMYQYTLRKGNRLASFSSQTRNAKVAGTQRVLTYAPLNFNGVTYIALSDLMLLSGMRSEWNSASKTLRLR